MREHLASPDVGEPGNMMAQSPKEHAVDTANDLLFESTVSGDLFLEDVFVGDMGACGGIAGGVGDFGAEQNKWYGSWIGGRGGECDCTESVINIW